MIPREHAADVSQSAAISWQIYAPSKESHGLRPVLVAIVESGALYTVTVLTSLALLLTTSYAQTAVLDMLMPLVVGRFVFLAIHILLTRRA